MEPEQPSSATRELLLWRSGDPGAVERLLPLVYGELRNLAGGIFRGQRQQQTLQPTALVHEAFLRLVDQERVSVNDRAHFRALAPGHAPIPMDHAQAPAQARRDQRHSTRSSRPRRRTARDLTCRARRVRRPDLDAPASHRGAAILRGSRSTIAQLGVRSTVEREWRAARAWLGARLHERGAG
jgi:hypothetical protein